MIFMIVPDETRLAGLMVSHSTSPALRGFDDAQLTIPVAGRFQAYAVKLRHARSRKKLCIVSRCTNSHHAGGWPPLASHESTGAAMFFFLSNRWRQCFQPGSIREDWVESVRRAPFTDALAPAELYTNAATRQFPSLQQHSYAHLLLMFFCA